MIAGIYKIINLVNNKIYIGSAVNFNKRKNNHKSKLLMNKHHSKKLQNAWNKYGFENFEFEIIEECEKEKLIEREQYYIDLYNSFNEGYNCCPIAGSSLGAKRSDDFKRSQSDRNMGNSYGKGYKWTEENKNKLRLFRTGKSCLKQTKDKIAISNSGRKNGRYNPIPVLQYDLNDNLIKEWQDLISLKEKGFDTSNIANVCREKLNSYRGYKWKFKY